MLLVFKVCKYLDYLLHSDFGKVEYFGLKNNRMFYLLILKNC